MGTTITNRISLAAIVCYFRRFFYVSILAMVVFGCSSSKTYAPVADLNFKEPVLQPVKYAIKNQQINKITSAKTLTYQPKPAHFDGLWMRPVEGSLISLYSNKHAGWSFVGLNGDPVVAAASGKVVYAGDGLRGYGNLIVIKHDKTFLSIYAHNRIVLVKSGNWVNKGQKIAEMGGPDRKKIMLYFEIRKNGIPVNPAMIRGIM